MTDEKLVQSPEEDDMYALIHEEYVCPVCGSSMQHDYVNIETGLIELVWLCHYCGHME